MSDYDNFIEGAPLGYDDGDIRGEFMKQPNIENVVFIDEYPALEEKLRLQRLARPAVKAALHDMHQLLIFEQPELPDGAA